MSYSGKIKVAVAGIGNCASSLIEGVCHYRRNPSIREGLLFPSLCGYVVGDIEFVAAFDISKRKVSRPLKEAIYQEPNNFVRLPGVEVDIDLPVLRGPTLDGNPEHLARFVPESPDTPVDVAAALRGSGAQILINLLPTGSNAAVDYYARAAWAAGCAFINCIPTPIAQRKEFQDLFREKRLPLLGDDIKSQMGTTILHRSLLGLLEMRGAKLKKTSQINIGGNTDFANFVHRAETKLVSKKKSLARYVGDTEFHVGHHFDPTKGPLKDACIDIEAAVFGGSPVRLTIQLRSDDKPNSAGSVVDLIRLAKGALEEGAGGPAAEVCAFYMKSPPVDMEDSQALQLLTQKWNFAQRVNPRLPDPLLLNFPPREEIGGGNLLRNAH